MKPDVRELTYSRKSIKANAQKEKDNPRTDLSDSNQTSKLSIPLVKNITKGKRIDSYGDAPWFDDALR